MEETMPRWAVKAILLTVIMSVPLCCASMTNHTVGGPTGWDLSSDIQAWSTTTSFRVGDTLVFTYNPNHDVLEVNQMEYTTCLAVNPISAHDSGDTVVPLIEPGTRYFICGRNGHCALGLKFRVDVIPQLDANVTRGHGGGRPGGGSPPLRHAPPPPNSSNGEGPHVPDIDVPDIPETNPSPGPCGNSAVGGLVNDWLFDYWWVPLFTTLLVSSLTHCPRLRYP